MKTMVHGCTLAHGLCLEISRVCVGSTPFSFSQKLNLRDKLKNPSPLQRINIVIKQRETVKNARTCNSVMSYIDCDVKSSALCLKKH